MEKLLWPRVSGCFSLICSRESLIAQGENRFRISWWCEARVFSAAGDCRKTQRKVGLRQAPAPFSSLPSCWQVPSEVVFPSLRMERHDEIGDCRVDQPRILLARRYRAYSSTYPPQNFDRFPAASRPGMTVTFPTFRRTKLRRGWLS